MLYCATLVNEWAILRPTPLAEAAAQIREEVSRESRPRLAALEDAAWRRGVPFLWDDELVTVGMAARSQTFPRDALPESRDLDWPWFRAIPIALVTGTNGKTTSARWIARMLVETGLVVGHTSTDGVAVNGRIVEPGDFTGPEGARNVLRRPEIEVAVLETARGGILRRGLAVQRAEVALITNVTADHLGEYGIADLATLARVKGVVASVVPADGHVILNGDDPASAPIARRTAASIVRFSLSPFDEPTAFFADEGSLWRRDAGGKRVRLAAVNDVPLAFGGRARYNLANALGAAAVAWALGVPDDAIARGLTGLDADDNPGRGRVIELAGGGRVLLDFAHNPAALRGALSLATTLGGGGALRVVFTQAGNRDDQHVRDMAATIAQAFPARVFLFEIESLLRGRPPGEVPTILTRELFARGVDVTTATDELAAVEQALSATGPGDVVVVTPNMDRPGVLGVLERRRR
jgi:UDP-N-acetylmuramyl tripeptide synthase